MTGPLKRLHKTRAEKASPSRNAKSRIAKPGVSSKQTIPNKAAAKPSLRKIGNTPPPRRTRLAPADREDQIVKGAIRFFAERGFGGQTRDLARQIGITQGLLYRYFPTKDILIERIYEELFVDRAKPESEIQLFNRSQPLLPRLIRFYLDYSKVLHDYEWGRILLYSGLGGASIAKRFVQQIQEGLFRQVIDELRYEFRRPDSVSIPVTESEMELMWGLHGSIFYMGIRATVYDVKLPEDVPATVQQTVEQFFANARKIMQTKSKG